MTYAQLEIQARIAAKALHRLGVAHGDHVAFLIGNNVVFPVLFQALMKLGAVAVPLNKRLPAEDVAYMARHVNARALIFDSDMETVLSQAMERCGFSSTLMVCNGETFLPAIPWDGLVIPTCDKENAEEGCGYSSPDDESLVLFTSGTTGRPKAVVRTAEAVSMLATVQLIEGHSHEGTVDVLYTQAPLYHMGGLCAMLKTCATSGTLIAESHFDPATVLDLVERYSVNQLYMIPPALFSRLYDVEQHSGRTFPGVLETQCAGGRTRECDWKAVFALFPNARVRVSFGSTETGMTCTSYFTKNQYAERPERGRAVGSINAFVTMKLVDEEGEPVPAGQPGEALVKSPAAFSGYRDLPLATAEAFDEDGFFRTGDMLYLDEEGCYVFVDRMSDMIKTGGENVFAAEVEQVVQQFPAIEDCAVVGVDDDRYGEGIAAAIVLEPKAADSFSPDALIAFCKEHMASFKKPRYLAIMDEIPRNSLGKVQKNELRARRGEFNLVASQ